MDVKLKEISSGDIFLARFWPEEKIPFGYRLWVRDKTDAWIDWMLGPDIADMIFRCKKRGYKVYIFSVYLQD